ncbi:MAG TPA: glutathione synthase [Casimicrobiaceae bacterium]|nr:glutathione synthase [Casimicrobiaceae bacterium]
MDFAFILDPLDSLKAYKDSSVAMMRALTRRGHGIFSLGPGDIRWEHATTRARTLPIDVLDDDHAWYRAHDSTTRRLAEFDAVLMRKDPPFDMEYVYSTYLLEAAEREGALVFNKPRAIRDNNEKLAIAKFAQFTAPTLVTRDPIELQGFIDEHQDVIVKPLDGMGGTSIFRVRHDDPNRNVIVETVGAQGVRTVMIQQYLPEIAQGDKRVLLIAGEAVPYSLARIPKAGESRGNLAAGGTGIARPLDARDREIAETIAPALWNEGLLVVGLDVIGPCLTEVNVTSPTCFVEITQQTGFDVAAMFADALLSAVDARRKHANRRV